MSTVLKTTHNAGFFSCSTIRLIDIMKYFNEHGTIPDIVDSSEQWVFYKENEVGNIVPELFEELDIEVPTADIKNVTYEPGEVSFGDYSKFLFHNTEFFVKKYFSPSQRVQGIIKGYEADYAIDYENTCAIFYRGNDKQRECDVTPYGSFIQKAQEVLDANPDVRFLVQPDETEFLEAFTAAFPGRCFWFMETPHMRSKNSAIFFELPHDQKTAHACYFLAAVMVMAKCKHVITHSGNGGMWVVLYRGNFDNVHQFITKHIY